MRLQQHKDIYRGSFCPLSLNAFQTASPFYTLPLQSLQASLNSLLKALAVPLASFFKALISSFLIPFAFPIPLPSFPSHPSSSKPPFLIRFSSTINCVKIGIAFFAAQSEQCCDEWTSSMAALKDWMLCAIWGCVRRVLMCRFVVVQEGQRVIGDVEGVGFSVNGDCFWSCCCC